MNERDVDRHVFVIGPQRFAGVCVAFIWCLNFSRPRALSSLSLFSFSLRFLSSLFSLLSSLFCLVSGLSLSRSLSLLSRALISLAWCAAINGRKHGASPAATTSRVVRESVSPRPRTSTSAHTHFKDYGSAFVPLWADGISGKHGIKGQEVMRARGAGRWREGRPRVGNKFSGAALLFPPPSIPSILSTHIRFR